ncbi:GldG family protein [Algiphilus sp.]|uniref:GldG family protein n=1 Tax=Algiphilus sp. TaxID=1872431 RepID=UPI0032F010CB
MTTARLFARWQHLLRIVLVLVLVALVGAASQLYKHSFDWTYGNRNSLSEASVELLARMPGPITFTAFTSSDAEAKRSVMADLARYRRVKDDIEIRFVDPSRQPQVARSAGIRRFNEVQVQYQGNAEVIRDLAEPSVTSALQRLAEPEKKVLYVLQGHGERSLDDDGELGMQRLVSALRDTGLGVKALNLAAAGTIPEDATAIVLLSPQRALLQGEQQQVARWIEDGGNLLWFADPDSAAELGPINEAVGVQWQPGVAVFPDFEATSGHPGILLVTEYPPNPVTQRLEEITVFPLVRGLDWDMNSEWRGMPLVVTRDSAWLETGPIEGDLAFEQAAGDIRGPITIGATLTREHDHPSGEGSIQQRVVLFGDSDFLADVYFEEVGNRQLAQNLFQWAATRDRQLSIEVPTVPDASLHMSGFWLTVIAAAFVIGIPLLLLLFGVARWVVRRRR